MSSDRNGFARVFRGYKCAEVNRYIELADAKHASELAAAEAECRKLRDGTEELRKENERVCAALADEKEKLNVFKSVSELDKQRLNDTIADLQKQIDSLRDSLAKKSAELEECGAESEKLRRQLLEITAENIILQKNGRVRYDVEKPDRQKDKSFLKKVFGDILD